MGDYFKPRRRKAGCIALVMGLAFMAGWMRSEVKADQFYFGSSEFTGDGILSFQGKLICNHIRHLDNGTLPEVIVERCENLWDFFIAHQLTSDDPFEWQLTLNICGIHRRDVAGPEFSMTVFTIPYWSIAVPLTLLSAALLLWPKRPKSQDDESASQNRVDSVASSSHNPVGHSLGKIR